MPAKATKEERALLLAAIICIEFHFFNHNSY